MTEYKVINVAAEAEEESYSAPTFSIMKVIDDGNEEWVADFRSKKLAEKIVGYLKQIDRQCQVIDCEITAGYRVTTVRGESLDVCYEHTKIADQLIGKPKVEVLR